MLLPLSMIVAFQVVNAPPTADSMSVVNPGRDLYPGLEIAITTSVAEYVFVFESTLIAHDIVVTRRVFRDTLAMERSLRLYPGEVVESDLPGDEYMFLFQTGDLLKGYFILRHDAQTNGLHFRKAYFEDLTTDRGVSAEFIDRTNRIMNDLLDSLTEKVQ